MYHIQCARERKLVGMDVALGKCEFIENNKDLSLVLDDARDYTHVSLDTENSGGLDPLSPNVKLLLVQVGIGDRAYVIDARKTDVTLLRELVESNRWIKTLQNAVYDYKMLKAKRGLSLQTVFDTKIAENLLTAGMKKGNSLEDLAFRYLELKLDKSTVETFFEHPYDAPFTEEQIKYAANDVLVLPEIRIRQWNCLKQYGLIPIAEIEFLLTQAVGEMELTGFKLDADLWSKGIQSTRKKIFKVGTKLRNSLPNLPAPPPKPIRLKKDGTPYANTAKFKPPPVLNLDSWQQVAWACSQVGINLYDANKKTRKGVTNVNTLKYAMSLYDDDKREILANIIKYRGLKQVEKTFGDNLIEHIKWDGRIHARFDQMGTDAGRFSSYDPNLQNIQKKGEEGFLLRSCFVPEKGKKFVIADYSQLHLRIAAEMSGDPVMLFAFSDPSGDIHKATASLMFKVPIDQVTPSQRKAAKIINFGIIYGMYLNSLKDRLGCSSTEAEDLMTKYRETYKVLMDWLDEQSKLALERGWARTLGGRYRWFPSLATSDKNYKRLRSFYERVGRNHPILGTDGDMLKIAMVLLYNPLRNFGATMVNCVHDELVVEVPEEHAIEVAHLVRSKMIVAGRKLLTKVPIIVDVKIRDNWWKDDGVGDGIEGQQLLLIPPGWGLSGNGD